MRAHADADARADRGGAHHLLCHRGRARRLACAPPTPQVRAAAAARAALLTPIAKAFSTDIGNEVASLGVQIHGGMGFIEETGAAQHFRDARITPIYEGTNGIQSIDLVTRKLAANGGASVFALLDELAGDRQPRSSSPTIPRSAPPRRNCATRSARSIAPAAGCWSASPRRRTTRWPARRRICGCSARRSAAACSPAKRWPRATRRRTAIRALCRAGAVFRREHHRAGRRAGTHGDRQRRGRERCRRGAGRIARRHDENNPLKNKKTGR